MQYRHTGDGSQPIRPGDPAGTPGALNFGPAMPKNGTVQKLALLAFIIAIVVVPARLANRSATAGPTRVMGWIVGCALAYWFGLRFIAFRLPN